MKIFASLIAVAGLLVLASAANADIMYETGPAGATYYENVDGVLGSEFTPTQNITIGKLGVFDYSSDGLVDSHQVGLWTLDGTLLASATVPAGTAATLINGYRWVDVSAVQLVQSVHYVVGAFFPAYPNGAGGDYFMNSATIDPAFTFVGDRLDEITPVTFRMPVPPSNGSGMNGPNVMTPEPATISFLVFGGVGMLLRRRRK
jgi:hypothetical protein